MEQTNHPQNPDDETHHPNILQNEDPNIFYTVYTIATGTLQLYGWYILFAVVALIFLGLKLQKYFHEQKQNRSESAAKKYDANETYKRHEAMEVARMRMQQQHQNMAEKFSEEEKKKQEEKRKSKIEDWERHQEGKGYRSKIKCPETQQVPPKSAHKKNVYRTTDHSPLSGEDSGGACFRPARRGGASGG